MLSVINLILPFKSLILMQKEWRYNTNLKEIIDAYDDHMEQYTKKRSNGQTSSNWSKRVTSFYSKPYYQNIAQMLKQQGFTCKNMK